MVTEPDRAGEAPHWREMLEKYPSLRQVFHELCALGEDEDATELLDYAARQEWMADVARRAANEAKLENTMPVEPETDDLLTTLWQLYAASRVRDVLLFAHQPAPVDDTVRELDKALYREPPRFRPVAVDEITRFFATIGCQPVTEASFDPILHEIVTCAASEDPAAPIQIIGQAWPALMIGELVFTRAGVHIQAGAAHAVPGVADRSTLEWEYWRRHRITTDASFWWGTNSQWRTEIRRDYITSSGHVYNYDGFSNFRRRNRLLASDDSADQPLTADRASFIKNRCQLRTDADPDFNDVDCGIDERRR